MAKSKLAVVESGAEQTVVEPEAGIDSQSAPEIPAVPESGETPAVELAFIKPKNQRYIAVAIEGQQSAPSLSQAQRMRDLDQKKLLNPDMIDGIMLEEKKKEQEK